MFSDHGLKRVNVTLCECNAIVLLKVLLSESQYLAD